MSTRNDMPVAIVGAGPTGVMLAIELARRGVGVRVLDRQPARSPESRAIGIHARTLEVFHQLGIVQEFLAHGHRVDNMLVHTRWGPDVIARFASVDSRYPFLLTLSQAETQRILDAKLETLGVRIERGVEVQGLEQDRDGVRLHTDVAGTVHAGWVVGCDGARSIVRRSLGVPFEGEAYGQDWLMTEVTVQSPLRRDCFHVFAGTPSVLPLFPLPGERWRVFVPQVPDRSARVREAPTFEEIERLIAQRGPAGLTLSNPSLLAAFRCDRREAGVLRAGRVLVAGDAAHIHSPAGGQGMNTGLQDAYNLGWKLALVIQQRSPETLLDTYQAERLPIVRSVLGLTHGLVRTFTLTSPAARWLRDRMLPAVMTVPAVERRYVNRLAQVSHTYRNGPLATPARRFDALASGDRLPVVSGLERDGRPVCTLDLLSGTAHTLVVLVGEQRGAGETPLGLGRWEGMVRTVVVSPSSGAGAVVDPALRAHRRYGARRGRLMLVRPDGHVAALAPLDRSDIIGRYLERLS